MSGPLADATDVIYVLAYDHFAERQARAAIAAAAGVARADLDALDEALRSASTRGVDRAREIQAFVAGFA